MMFINISITLSYQSYSINRFSEYRDYKQFLIYIYDPLIFDLMTLTSTQFIGSARCPELNSNPSVSSNENTFTSYFLHT